MKKNVLLLLFLTLSLLLNAQTIRVMTFNIRFGELADMKEIAKIIAKQKPDIVALQEVDIFVKRPQQVKAGSNNYIALLGGYTEMHSLFGKTIDYGGGDYGVGILSKTSFESSQNYNYTHNGVEKRTALEVIIRLKNNEKVRFVCTHLDHNNGKVRKEQIEELGERFGTDSIPTIVAGDFNETPNDANGAIALLDKYFVRACNPDIPTFPESKPRVKIDYVCYSRTNNWKVKKKKVIDVKGTSDHRAVLVDLKLKK